MALVDGSDPPGCVGGEDVEVDGQVVLLDEIIGTPESLIMNCQSLMALYNRAPFK